LSHTNPGRISASTMTSFSLPHQAHVIQCTVVPAWPTQHCSSTIKTRKRQPKHRLPGFNRNWIRYLSLHSPSGMAVGGVWPPRVWGVFDAGGEEVRASESYRTHMDLGGCNSHQSTASARPRALFACAPHTLVMLHFPSCDTDLHLTITVCRARTETNMSRECLQHHNQVSSRCSIVPHLCPACVLVCADTHILS
jgi:hypothetical protein